MCKSKQLIRLMQVGVTAARRASLKANITCSHYSYLCQQVNHIKMNSIKQKIIIQYSISKTQELLFHKFYYKFCIDKFSFSQQ
jgi:hypothetical protein